MKKQKRREEGERRRGEEMRGEEKGRREEKRERREGEKRREEKRREEERRGEERERRGRGEKRRGKEKRREENRERREEKRKCTEVDGGHFVKAGNVLQCEKHRKNGVVTVRMKRHEERSNTVLRSRQHLLHLFNRNDTLIVQFIYLIQNIDDDCNDTFYL